MFFPPPRRHELEIIEKHLSCGNNLCFIDTVENPTAVFWFLISYLKNMGQSLVNIETSNSVANKVIRHTESLVSDFDESATNSFSEIINEYY